MAKGGDSHLEIIHVSQSDGINVKFDQNCAPSSGPRSRSKSGSAGRHRRRHNRKGGNRSSSRSRSPSRNRSRSHPRCHRSSSRCRCDNHRGSGRVCRSPSRRHKDNSGSPSPSRHSRSRRHRTHSRPTSHKSRQSKEVSRFSQSPPSNNGSRSGSSEHSVNLSLDDKEILVEAAEAIAITIPGAEMLELPENVKPILLEQAVESKRLLSGTWVRQDPEKTPSESDEDPDDVFSSRMSPKRKTISFSINNAVLKPTGAAPSGAKVTSRVDSYESRKPYGHWMPVKSGHASSARKQALAMSH
ncbi:arginine/serine-rich protein 1 [Pseudoliparis swirei]|uniref:arginine/serine-rich protein 1 n=1 Tax=Pseudoliparis swirei TaxID=2059687 RepID=UPI0024BE8EBE|nr:arginine/serine-rich protein 1 [Pseudoliparis swirei]